MNLESIVTSLELSQKLDSAGVASNSLFFWYIDTETKFAFVVGQGSVVNSERKYEIFSAFTAQELLEIVDETLTVYHICYFNNSIEIGATRKSDKRCFVESDESGNLANCLAQLIIRQKENENVNA